MRVRFSTSSINIVTAFPGGPDRSGGRTTIAWLRSTALAPGANARSIQTQKTSAHLGARIIIWVSKGPGRLAGVTAARTATDLGRRFSAQSGESKCLLTAHRCHEQEAAQRRAG